MSKDRTSQDGRLRRHDENEEEPKVKREKKEERKKKEEKKKKKFLKKTKQNFSLSFLFSNLLLNRRLFRGHLANLPMCDCVWLYCMLEDV